MDVEALKRELVDEIGKAVSLAALEELRLAALGRKGRVTELLKGLGALDPEARKAAGRELNLLKDELAAALEARKLVLAEAELDARLAGERLDVSLPAAPERHGRIHPISQTVDELCAIFGEMGFAVAEGPDIEDDFHNFTALNSRPSIRRGR